jgi:hypothetical protein
MLVDHFMLEILPLHFVKRQNDNIFCILKVWQEYIRVYQHKNTLIEGLYQVLPPSQD